VQDVERELADLLAEVAGVSFWADSAFLAEASIPTVLYGHRRGRRARPGGVGEYQRHDRLRPCPDRYREEFLQMSGHTVTSHRDPGLVPPPAGAEVQDFHRGLAGYRPTPLRQLGDHAWLKDESDRFGLPAFKILGASWAIERTLRAHPGTRVLVAASAGNHGRAVARAASIRGLDSRIYLPLAVSATRAELIAAEGADVVRVDGDYNEAVALAVKEAHRPGAALIADTASEPEDGPPAWVIDGYSTLFREVAEQASKPFDVVLVPVGVGSFAAAAVRWAAHEQPGAAVIAVEPDTAACLTVSLREGCLTTVDTPGTGMAGMDCATPSAVAWPTLRHGLAGTITVSDGQAHAAMSALADRGWTIGDCGAAAVAALGLLTEDPGCADLRAAVDFGPESSVLCVATEGASDPDAYQRTVAAFRECRCG
jgi:diaminopropionate ammonia-lyase